MPTTPPYFEGAADGMDSSLSAGGAIDEEESNPDTAWVACAVSRDLMLQLESVVAQADSDLVSVMPHVMTAFNGARSVLQKMDCWFVQVEKDKLLMALITGGHWQTLSSRQITGDRWQQELPLLIDREWRINGVQQVSREVVISAPEASQATMNGGPVRTYTTLWGARKPGSPFKQNNEQ